MKRTGILRRALTLGMAFCLLWLCGCAGASQDAGGADNQPPLAEASEGTDLEVLALAAGKADAFLLTTANSAVLIDAGEKGFGKTVLAVLEEKGIQRLDYMIITHFDQDHVGGAARILNHFAVDHVLQNDCPKDSEEYEKYVKALSSAALEAVTVQETYSFTLDGVSYAVDPPRKNKYNEDNSNNHSLIVSVRNGENDLLFMGDAQTERISEFLSWNDQSYEVLKVPHHGKADPLMADLIASVSPVYAIITSSDEEPEEESVLDALAGAEVYLTRLGAVRLLCDGTDIRAEYTVTAEGE